MALSPTYLKVSIFPALKKSLGYVTSWKEEHLCLDEAVQDGDADSFQCTWNLFWDYQIFKDSLDKTGT